MRLKQVIKEVIAHGLYGLGLLQMWQRRVCRRRAVVLMYHRVLDDEQWQTTGSHPGMSVRCATFDRQMAVLRERFAPLSLEQFVDHMGNRQPFPDSACLVTFDDGWRDTLTNAVPTLRKHQVPVSIFLPTGFIGTRRMFTREAFTHLALQARERAGDPVVGPPLRRLLEDAGLGRVLSYDGADPRAAVVAALGDRPVTSAIEVLVTQLSQLLGVTPEELSTPDTFMTWRDVEALSRDGVAFGGHGTDHRLLATLSADEVEREVAQSQAALAAGPAPRARAFSYPNGSCNPDVAARVKAHGYQVAFTIEPGVVGCEDDPMFIRRVNISEAVTASTPMFLARLVGLF